MKSSAATLMWIPVILGGCDFLFPPCTNFKRVVCACEEAGADMCDVAEAAEENAQEHKDNGDDHRYDSAQDACETLLDAWDEADGCTQFSAEESEDVDAANENGTEDSNSTL